MGSWVLVPRPGRRKYRPGGGSSCLRPPKAEWVKGKWRERGPLLKAR